MGLGLLSGVSGADIASGVGIGTNPISTGLGLLNGVGKLGLLGGGGKVKNESAAIRDTISGFGDFIVRNEGSTINNDSKAPVYNKPLVDFSDPKEVLALVLTLVIVTYVYKKVKS